MSNFTICQSGEPETCLGLPGMVSGSPIRLNAPVRRESTGQRQRLVAAPVLLPEQLTQGGAQVSLTEAGVHVLAEDGDDTLGSLASDAGGERVKLGVRALLLAVVKPGLDLRLRAKPFDEAPHLVLVERVGASSCLAR